MGRKLVGYREFTDGPRRPIWEDEQGQYVEDEDGCKIRGVYFIPPDEADVPLVVPSLANVH